MGKGNPAFHYEVFTLLELWGEMALDQRVHTESSQAGTHANID